GVGIDINEDRPCSGLNNRCHGGDEGHWDSDHLVARADSRSEHREPECVGAAANSDDVAHTEKVAEFPLEVVHGGAADVGGALMDRGEIPGDAVLNLAVLCSEV